MKARRNKSVTASSGPVGLAALTELMNRRWLEAMAAVQLPPDQYLTWDVGEYDHFNKPRGYGVTLPLSKWKCHIRLADKMLSAPQHRQDGIIRHEIGHVLDIIVTPTALDAWAAGRGVFLPKTPELRADAIAHAVWGSRLKYQAPLFIQSTTTGQASRPEHLGL